jgi:hypothetical protein
MKTLTSLPIAIFLALTTAGCDESRDLEELEELELTIGAAQVDDELDAEWEAEKADFDADDDDDEDYDLDDEIDEDLQAHPPLPYPEEDDLGFTVETEVMPDPPMDNPDDMTAVEPEPDPDPAPPEAVPCQAPFWHLPAHPINDYKANHDGPGPDPEADAGINDVAAVPQDSDPDPQVPCEGNGQYPLPPGNPINDYAVEDEQPDPDAFPIDDFTANPGS